MNYEEIFSQRGNVYDEAMRKYPLARNEEFNLIVEHLTDAKNLKILDIPAGGGYLEGHIPKVAKYYGFEPTNGFANNIKVGTEDIISGGMNNLPYSDCYFDYVSSLAGVHHTIDKNSLWSEWYRVLKYDGYIIVVDVDRDSNVSRFLDEFVGKYNSTGHNGYYLSPSSINEMKECGFKNVESTIRSIYWRFDSLNDMCDFVIKLFGLEVISPNLVLENIENFLGYELDQSGVKMNWELNVILAKK